ncbi:hypothetical protein HDU78_011217 [Chytriomyces hyalinus]|nr:hypothetical protein HDU78_011217 [Chytriomyces hyalinus]
MSTSPTHTPPLTTNGLNTPQKKSEKKSSLLRKLVFTRDSSSSESSVFMNAGSSSSSNARLPTSRSPGFQLQPIRPQDEPQFSVSRTHTFSHQDAPSISARQNSIMGRLRDLVGPGASPQSSTDRYTTKPTVGSSSSKKWSAKKWMQSDAGGPRVPKLFQRGPAASEVQQD